MRWRMTAAEEMRWTVGGGGATMALTTMTKKQHSKSVWWQKAGNDNGWQEAGRGG
jgi:hypothetical protein